MNKKCISRYAGNVRASQKMSKNRLQKNTLINRNVTTQQTLHYELHTHHTLVRGSVFHIQEEFLKKLIFSQSYNVYNRGYFHENIVKNACF